MSVHNEKMTAQRQKNTVGVLNFMSIHNISCHLPLKVLTVGVLNFMGIHNSEENDFIFHMLLECLILWVFTTLEIYIHSHPKLLEYLIL